MRVVCRPTLVDCIEEFGRSHLVIGNDTGISHLAALTSRRDGSSPAVICLYGRQNYLKWTTGRTNHHAIAGPMAQMLALADIDYYVNQYGATLDDDVWGLGDIRRIRPADIARQCARHLRVLGDMKVEVCHDIPDAARDSDSRGERDHECAC
jgi:hypothetical protein